MRRARARTQRLGVDPALIRHERRNEGVRWDAPLDHIDDGQLMLCGRHDNSLRTAQCQPISATVSPVATLDGDPDLNPLNGDPRPFSDWLTTFPMLVGAIDPYTHESSWLLDTIKRLFHHYRDAGVRVAWLASGPADGVSSFLGPYAEEFLTFSDPDRVAVKALGLSTLPALALVRQDGEILASAEGWDPVGWRAVIDAVDGLTGWTPISVPGPKDPAPYAGTPV